MAANRAIRAEMSPHEWALRVELAGYFRINAHLGWEDSINTHSTARVPGAEHHFLINPFGLRFSEVKASDLIKVDVDGNVIGESAHPVNHAGYVIHSAIHRQRPNARCVLHTHPVAGMVVAAMAHGLLPIGIFALGFHNCLSYHNYEGASGEHNLSERERLAESLGPNNHAMIMRNHGLLTVGETLPEAFVWMYRLTKACEVQALAQAGRGEFVVPSEGAAESTVKGVEGYLTGYGTGGRGEVEFQAFMRLMDELDPSFRD